MTLRISDGTRPWLIPDKCPTLSNGSRDALGCTAFFLRRARNKYSTFVITYSQQRASQELKMRLYFAHSGEELHDRVVGWLVVVVRIEEKRRIRRPPRILDKIMVRCTQESEQKRTRRRLTGSRTPQTVMETHLGSARHALTTFV